MKDVTRDIKKDVKRDVKKDVAKDAMIMIVIADVAIHLFKRETLQISRVMVPVAARSHNRNFLTSEKESASAGFFYLLGIGIT